MAKQKMTPTEAQKRYSSTIEAAIAKTKAGAPQGLCAKQR